MIAQGEACETVCANFDLVIKNNLKFLESPEKLENTLKLKK